MSDLLTSKPSDEERALLEAIRAEPDALGPRLVYADWLQQRGEVLGEYISLMIAFSRVPADDPSIKSMSDRLKEIDLPKTWLSLFGYYPETEMGLPAQLQLRKADINADLADRLERTVIRELTIIQGGLVEEQLPFIEAVLPKMRLRHIRVDEWIPINVLGVLLTSRFVTPDLESLALRSVHLNDDVLTLLATTPLPRLTRLAIEGTRYNITCATDLGVMRLANSPYRRQLRELSLPQHAISVDGVTALLNGQLPLTSINLSGNPLGAAGIRAIVESPRASHLESITIADTKLDQEAIEILANAKQLTQLKKLGLADIEYRVSGITDKLLEILVASPFLPKTMQLDIDGTPLNLNADIGIDGMNGLPCWSSWAGDVPERVQNRFKVNVVGAPSY